MKKALFTCSTLCSIWRGYGNINCLELGPESENRAKALLVRKTNVDPSLRAIIATAPLECQKMSKRAT